MQWNLVMASLLLLNIRVFVGAFNAVDPVHIYDLALEGVPPAVYPDVWDIFIVMGGLGAAALVYLVATRLVPIISIWETKEGAQYQRMDTLIRGEYLVLAKPE